MFVLVVALYVTCEIASNNTWKQVATNESVENVGIKAKSLCACAFDENVRADGNLARMRRKDLCHSDWLRTGEHYVLLWCPIIHPYWC
jgi:hypothetical protein